MRDAKDSIASFLEQIASPQEASPQTEKPKLRVKVEIAGEQYTIAAAEEEDYIRRVASFVDSRMTSLISEGKAPVLNAAVLTACNVVDDYFKCIETADNLRAEIKNYIDDLAQLRNELADLRRGQIRFK